MAELFPEARYLEIVHLSPKHKFCIIFRAEGLGILRNTPKHRFGSNRLDWMRLWQTIFQVRYPEIVHSAPKHEFGMIFDVKGLRNAPKHSQISIWV